MKILITGSSGFVGTSLVPFLKNNWKEISLVNRTDVGDFKLIENWESYLKGIDVVIHLAGRAHCVDEDTEKVREVYFEENVVVTSAIAKAAQACNVKKFIYLSSIKANGEGNSTPYTEKTLEAPIGPYGESKLAAEKELEKISLNGRMKIVTIRPSLIYGPGVKANFKTMINIVRKGFPLPFKSFNAKRSYLFVGNLNDFIRTLLIRDLDKKYDVVCISDGNDLTLPEVLTRIAKALNVQSRIFNFPPKLLKLALYLIGKKSVYKRLNNEMTLSIEKACRCYNWKPPYSFHEGMKITVKQ